MLSSKYSFRLVPRQSKPDKSAKVSETTSPEVAFAVSPSEIVSEPVKTKSKRKTTASNSDQDTIDSAKRSFLKFAGVAGLGVAASALFPGRAEAYVAGSTPTSNVVGVKNSANTRIDPATEATLALIQAKTANLTFDGDNNLLTAQSAAASAVGIKDTTNTLVNPATDDSAMLLRRLLRQVDSLAVVDSAQRQKVTLDSITSGLTLSTVTTVGTVSTVTAVTTVATVTSATNLVALGGVDGRYLHIDTARNMYSNGIRSNLLFS